MNVQSAPKPDYRKVLNFYDKLNELINNNFEHFNNDNDKLSFFMNAKIGDKY